MEFLTDHIMIPYLFMVVGCYVALELADYLSDKF